MTPVEEELRTVSVTVARIESKLDHLIATTEDHETRMRVMESHGTSSHATRIADLERWRWVVVGAALGAGGVAGGISSTLIG